MDSIEGTLEEMEGDVSYFEDLPAEWLEPGQAKFERIAERLRRLRESLNKQTTEETKWS